MRGKARYLSNNSGDCADDINLSTICNENEKKFLLWSKNLEDTITRLLQSVEYYDEFITQFIFDSKIFKKFNSFFTNFLTYLCVAITIDIGKLCSQDNELSLRKFLKFCEDNMNIFNNDISNLLVKNRGLMAKLEKQYKNQIFIPRNKIYGHSDELLLDNFEIDKYITQVSIDDLKNFSTISKDILSSIWYEYNHHKMCFRLKGYKDYKNLLRLVCAYCDESYLG